MLDDCDGLRFWSSDTLDGNGVRDPAEPARSIVSSIDGVEILDVYIFIEPYRSGAEVDYVSLFGPIARMKWVSAPSWLMGPSLYPLVL